MIKEICTRDVCKSHVGLAEHSVSASDVAKFEPAVSGCGADDCVYKHRPDCLSMWRQETRCELQFRYQSRGLRDAWCGVRASHCALVAFEVTQACRHAAVFSVACHLSTVITYRHAAAFSVACHLSTVITYIHAAVFSVACHLSTVITYRHAAVFSVACHLSTVITYTPPTKKLESRSESVESSRYLHSRFVHVRSNLCFWLEAWRHYRIQNLSAGRGA
jgi:hypothetical protein